MSALPLPRRDICAVIPCFNEAETIARIVRGVRAHVETVIVVDDCSEDETAREAEAAGALVLRHERNLGKGVALKTGFKAAAARGLGAAVTLDGDGQHDWREIPLFIEEFDKGGCDIVLGNRMNDTRSMPRMRAFTNRLTSRLISRMAGVPIADTQCGFRLVSLNFWKAVRLESSRFDLESEILIKALRGGARLKQVQIRTIYFKARRSKIKPVSDAVRFFALLWRCRNA